MTIQEKLNSLNNVVISFAEEDVKSLPLETLKERVKATDNNVATVLAMLNDAKLQKTCSYKIYPYYCRHIALRPENKFTIDCPLDVIGKVQIQANDSVTKEELYNKQVKEFRSFTITQKLDHIAAYIVEKSSELQYQRNNQIELLESKY